MSLYDDTNPQHLEHLARHKAAWTREKEAAFQRDMAQLRADREKQA